MIDLEFVQSLIRALDASTLDTLELERGGTRIRLSKSPTPSFASSVSPSATGGSVPAAAPGPGSPAPAAATTVPEEAPKAPSRLLEVKSPMVGTFYRAPSPDSPPYVDVGQKVGSGTVLCIIEAMKLMNELESEVSGTVAQILVENAQPVEYGQVLFLIDPA